MENRTTAAPPRESDVMTPGAFLNLLWQEKPEEMYVLLWTLQDKRSHWYRDVKAAAAFASNCNGNDVYVGVGLSRSDFGAVRRCTSDDIAGISGFWSDLDLRSEAHRKSLPGSPADALSIVPSAMPPTIVVATGNGLHPWWLFKEPLVFETDQERKDVAGLAARWHSLLRLNAAARGWAYDRLSDLARVLRIPGTLNHKDPQAPKPVTVHSFSGRRYNLSDFQKFLDGAAIPEADEHSRRAREWAQRFNDGPLSINLSARIPQELLDGWAAQDLRFRNTWFRQRHDLQDQSQSGYDLALADFGAEAGLTPQQIVDLIVHHRVMHKQKLRSRLDYFERTIARAAQRNGGPAALPVQPAMPAPADAAPARASCASEPAPAPAQEAAAPSVDPAAAKAALCEYISEVLGVRILRIVKITGKEPTYQVVLENAKVELAHIGKLLDQNSVRMAIATATNKLIKRLKPKLWDQLAQTMLDALIEQEGGPETQFEGAVRMYLEQYLSDVAFIPSIDGQPSNAIRRPMVIGAQVAVNSADLQLFVNKTFIQSLSVKAVASMLAAIGARNVRVRGARNREQGRWLLPIEEFDPIEFTDKNRHEEER
jgi:hypothetical protein